MIMCGVYLTYSAYFLSADFDTIYIVMNCLVSMMYAGLIYVYISNTVEQMDQCRQYLLEDVADDQNVMKQSLELKIKMLK